jgi:two-component system, OmpR family, sensor histidine kinase PhoQ
MASRNFSLRGRMLLVASLVLLLFLGMVGAVLDQAFRQSASEGESERLLLHIYGLLATMEETDGELFMPEALQEPQFNRLGSGLYALVLTDSGSELWRSPSSLDLVLPSGATAELHRDMVTGEPRFGYVPNDQGEPLFYLSYRVLWQARGGQTTAYIFSVLQTRDIYLGEVSSFRNNLWGWLVGVVILLIGVQALVMNWGLSPLRRLAEDLKRIEDGTQEYLEGDYPREIEGVTKNLNLLLSSERQQREKYRTTLADLAHSLKTPLAILRGAMDHTRAAAIDDIRITVDEQVARMNEIVGYQLERAVATSSTLTRKAIEIGPLVRRLIVAMRKVYAAKAITIDLEVADAAFFGDERDLMELLGNIVDNACKYGQSRVQVSVGGRNDAGRLLFVVEDDGEGISETDRTRVLARGFRLDSREPGQGIGLAVVGEIVARYGGELDIDDSPLGGVRVTVSLP